MHLNLVTSDLKQSVEFYATLLDARPAKLRDDYALFITNEPGLELALDAGDSAPPSVGVHYGICADELADVDRAIARLGRAGVASSVEREETCCYANQTKVWAIDPDGRRWEIYKVHSETDERNDVTTSCCSTKDGSRSCCDA